MGEGINDIKAEVFANWLTPAQALALLTDRGIRRDIAKDQLTRRLRDGLIASAARTIVIPGNKDIPSPCPIPRDWWDGVGEHHVLWQTADGPFIAKRGAAPFAVNAYEIRLDSNHVRAVVAVSGTAAPIGSERIKGTAPPSSPALAQAIERRGRPPKEWRDDLWVEMCRKIYEDGFAPKTQADIERAMLDWATSNDHEMSESTAKRAARKLFPIFKE